MIEINLLNLFYILFLLLFISNAKRINKEKNIVYLAFAINNRCVDLLYTSLYSLLENSSKNTIYHIYIEVKNNFENIRKEYLYNLEKQYFNCFIHFINMKREFKNAFRNHLDITTYYRLKLPLICSHIKRIIYIDADTIILKDLKELYSLNFNGKYILGRLDSITDELDLLGVYTRTYINAGVLLMDLYNLRKNDYEKKFMNYIKKHNNYNYLIHHAQTTINYICHDKIGLLKPKYHMWPFSSENILIKYNNNFRKKYLDNEFIKDFHNPFIVHFPGYFKDMKQNTIYHKKYKDYILKSKEFQMTKFKSLKFKINHKIIAIIISIKVIVFIFESLIIK